MNDSDRTPGEGEAHVAFDLALAAGRVLTGRSKTIQGIAVAALAAAWVAGSSKDEEEREQTLALHLDCVRRILPSLKAKAA